MALCVWAAGRDVSADCALLLVDFRVCLNVSELDAVREFNDDRVLRPVHAWRLQKFFI